MWRVLIFNKCANGLKTIIRQSKAETTIGTGNFHSVCAYRKVQELIHELKRYQCYIVGLAKVRWTGFGETTTEEGHKIWYCGEDSKHLYGVAFIVQKEVVGSIISCTPITSRFISIWMSARPHNINSFFSRSMHQPQTMKTRKAKGFTSSLIASQQTPKKM